MNRLLFCFLISFNFATTSPLAADIIELNLSGTAGEGLLPGNVTPGTSSSGSGGEGTIGLLFDTQLSELTIDIQWGSVYGFNDLTGPVTLLHLHGPTEDVAPDSFSQVTTNILVNMTNSLVDNTPNGGSLTADYFINPSDVAAILSGQTYINVHTEMYEMGEIRGYIVPAGSVPEPGSFGWCLSLIGLLASRRRRR